MCPGSSVPFQMYDRAISAPTSPTRLSHAGKRSWEEPNWMGSPRLLNKDMKTGLSRSLQTLPTDSLAFDTGEECCYLAGTASGLGHCSSLHRHCLSTHVPGTVQVLALVPSPSPFWAAAAVD